MRLSQKRNRRERGNVMTEAALVLVVFVFLIFGIFDFSQFLFLHQAMLERVRGAARWAVVNDPTNLAAVRNMVLYGQPTQGTTAMFGLKPEHVAVSNPGTGTDDYRLVVSITGYQYAILSPYVGGSYTGPNIVVSVPMGQ